MAESLGDRLTQLEQAVRRAADLIARLKAEKAALEKEIKDLRARAGGLDQERREVLAQVDSILKDLSRLEAGSGG